MHQIVVESLKRRPMPALPLRVSQKILEYAALLEQRAAESISPEKEEFTKMAFVMGVAGTLAAEHGGLVMAAAQEREHAKNGGSEVGSAPASGLVDVSGVQLRSGEHGAVPISQPGSVVGPARSGEGGPLHGGGTGQ